MKRYALALGLILVITFIATYLWALVHFPRLFSAR